MYVLEKGAALDAMDSYGRAVDAAPAFANAHQGRSRVPEMLFRRKDVLVAFVGWIFIDASRQDNRLVRPDPFWGSFFVNTLPLYSTQKNGILLINFSL